MKRAWLIGLLLCTWTLTGEAAAWAQSDPVYDVIRLVNELRISRGLPAYEVHPILMSVAQAQASWSAANNHIGHDGPGGSSPNDRAQAAGYGGGERSFATENAAHGTASYNTPDLVVSMWQSDWGHLNAMISPDYEHIGVGYAEAGGYSWYVMMVGWVGDKGGSTDAQPLESPEETLPLSPFILSEPDEDGAIYHEVQPGQSAWTIAAHYDVELAELLALNDLSEDSILHPGDVLLVRPPTSTAGSPTPLSATPVAQRQPTAVDPTPQPSPTAMDPSVTDTPPRSTAIPTAAVITLGIGLIVGLALIRVLSSRTKA
jgi:LysM repeat protein